MSETEVYKQFLGNNVKVTQCDNFPYYGEVTEVGNDYIVLKYKDKTTLLRFSAIIKIQSW